MSDLRELYEETILDHTRRPRNFHALPAANRHADGYNPLCGDKLQVFLRVQDNVIADASFLGTGCAISTASASLMTEAIQGKPLEEVAVLFEKFHHLLTGPPQASAVPAGLGKLAVFAGVREFPVRVKCATLAWHTLQAALKNAATPVSTE